jgi:hypothetical protein
MWSSKDLAREFPLFVAASWLLAIAAIASSFQVSRWVFIVMGSALFFTGLLRLGKRSLWLLPALCAIVVSPLILLWIIIAACYLRSPGSAGCF